MTQRFPRRSSHQFKPAPIEALSIRLFYCCNLDDYFCYCFSVCFSGGARRELVRPSLQATVSCRTAGVSPHSRKGNRKQRQKLLAIADVPASA
jgi:hypothetical protein